MRRLNKYVVVPKVYVSICSYVVCASYTGEDCDRICYYKSNTIHLYFIAEFGGDSYIMLRYECDIYQFDRIVHESSRSSDLIISYLPLPGRLKHFRCVLELETNDGRITAKHISETGATLEAVRRLIWQN